MNPRRRATVIAVAGTAAGATGLGVLAAPAGAGTAPELPPVEAQALVESVLRNDAPALSGTVAIESDLGLPSMRGVPALDAESARVFYDGEGRSRIALERESGEFTVVADDDEVWTYESAANTASHAERPADARTRRPETVDPNTLAQRMVAAAGQSSTISVDGTASVADRPAYELVLTPKPDERTLLREVRIAVDSETRLPLRLSVLTHGTTEPAVEVGFDDVEFGAQPADLFKFTPPENAEVTERTPGDGAHRDGEPHGNDASVETVGEGWDTVLLTRAPADLLAPGRDGTGADGRDGENSSNPERVRQLLGQVGERVSGPYGSGYLISTSAATALVTDDGRVAVGAVPEQVLTEALSSR